MQRNLKHFLGIDREQEIELIKDIKNWLEIGGELKIANLCILKIVDAKPRPARNPKTKEVVMLPQRKRLKTKVSKTYLKELREC